RDELIRGYADLATRIDPMAWYARCREQEGVLRSRIGRFVGADADEIALKISLTDGYGSVLWGLDWRPGDRVLVTDEEHPSPRLARWCCSTEPRRSARGRSTCTTSAATSTPRWATSGCSARPAPACSTRAARASATCAR